MPDAVAKHPLFARIGLVLVVVGGLVLVVVAGYYALSAYAYGQFSGLRPAAARDVLERDIPEGWQRPSVEPSSAQAPRPSTDGAASERARSQDGPSVELYPTPATGAGVSLSSAGTETRGVPSVSGMRAAAWDNLPRTIGKTPPAQRIQIPAIGVDSKIVELNTIWKDGVLEWETPKWAVGHHNGTANPGERNNMVLSGHISSPLLREGEVFKRLPEIPKLLDSGQIVDVIVYTKDTKYLYRVVKWELVKPEQLDVFAQTDEPTVTLITCYPDFAYWDRLIITGKLVGTAPTARE